MNADEIFVYGFWLVIATWVAIGCAVQTWKEHRR